MLGPADGRYVVRPVGQPEAEASHVLVLCTLGAPERRRLAPRQRRTLAAEPSPVATARATVIAGAPLGVAAAKRWLAAAGSAEVEAALAVVNRALAAHRVASADPHVREASRHQALVVRAGYGAGDQVADGRWSTAVELAPELRRQRRTATLSPQERTAALLGGHEVPLACEELVLRARLDLDAGRLREAALQLRPTLDAALAELASATALAERVAELRARRDAVVAAAEAATASAVPAGSGEIVTAVLNRLEAALRARAAAARAG